MAGLRQKERLDIAGLRRDPSKNGVLFEHAPLTPSNRESQGNNDYESR
jgi:hypothetical protein